VNGHKDELPDWARERLADQERMGDLKTTASAGDFAGGALVLVITAAWWALAIGFVGSCIWGLVWLVSS